jgi:hypothetical protein
LTSLFSSLRDENVGRDTFDKSLEDSSSSSDEGSGSDPEDPEHAPLEARRSLERQPLDIDDDEEMGEMVAPEGDGDRQSNSSDEEELSEVEKEKLRGSSFGSSASGGRPSYLDDESEGRDAEFQDEEEEDEEEGDELVEIAMPVSMGDGRRNSMGRG